MKIKRQISLLIGVVFTTMLTAQSIAQTTMIQSQSPQNWNSASPIARMPPTSAPT